MASTVTEVQTLKAVLDDANPNKIADALQKVKLGSILDKVDTGDQTITAAASFTLPNSGKALIVESCEVGASGTAASVGFYAVVPTGATEATPAAAGKGGGVATISADGTTITFPNTVTQVRVVYLAAPAEDLGEEFA
jgi:hypothetical protein